VYVWHYAVRAKDDEGDRKHETENDSNRL
jgi:hypothetical protein